MTINWRVTEGEHQLIVDIAFRASALARRFAVDYPQRDAIMDVTAVHANGNPLRLAELAAADEQNFGHDVFGIRRHLNRETGKLENCFSPRFSRPA